MQHGSSLCSWTPRRSYEKLGDAAAYLTASYLASAGLRLLSTVLFLWALLALYNWQSIATGTLGLWGFVVAFFGTALFAGSVWPEVFVYPTLARVAPTVFTGQSAEASSLIIGKNLSAYLFAIGIVLFGLATLKASVYPRWASALLVVSIPATIFSSEYGSDVFIIDRQIMFGSAFMHSSAGTPSSPRGTPAVIFQLARGYGNGSSPFDLAGIRVPAGGRTRCPVGEG